MRRADTGRCLLTVIVLVMTGVSRGTLTTTSHGLPTFATNTTQECWCDCADVINASINMTHEDLMREIQRIYNTLLLDKENISATLRKRISAPDSRPSAQSIGYVGVLVLVTSLGSIVILDSSTLVKDVKTGADNLRQMMAKESGTETYHSVKGHDAETPVLKHGENEALQIAAT